MWGLSRQLGRHPRDHDYDPEAVVIRERGDRSKRKSLATLHVADNQPCSASRSSVRTHALGENRHGCLHHIPSAMIVKAGPLTNCGSLLSQVRVPRRSLVCHRPPSTVMYSRVHI